ncbi:MAG: hypothetical protein Q7S31_00400 [bacterium]|nr:hypothetical protein [bacterium]
MEAKSEKTVEMNLKDFTKKTIEDLSQALEESPAVAGIRGVIDFDVAIVANESAGVGGGISVLGIGNAGGKVDFSNQTTSRVRFSVQTKKAISPGGNSRLNPDEIFHSTLI